MGISDIIEEYIKEMFGGSEEIEIKRNDLANRLGCVPSQINYVISTRFTNANGFIVESRRGGNGGITIRRAILKEDYISYLINHLGMTLKQNEAFSYIRNIYEYNLISAREANLMFAAVSDNTIKDSNEKDLLRARIFKNMLINLNLKG